MKDTNFYTSFLFLLTKTLFHSPYKYIQTFYDTNCYYAMSLSVQFIKNTEKNSLIIFCVHANVSFCYIDKNRLTLALASKLTELSRAMVNKTGLKVFVISSSPPTCMISNAPRRAAQDCSTPLPRFTDFSTKSIMVILRSSTNSGRYRCIKISQIAYKTKQKVNK